MHALVSKITGWLIIKAPSCSNVSNTGLLTQSIQRPRRRGPLCDTQPCAKDSGFAGLRLLCRNEERVTRERTVGVARRTFNVTHNCLPVLRNVANAHEEKQSANEPRDRAQHQAVLQTVEAPLGRLGMRLLYGVGNLGVRGRKQTRSSIAHRSKKTKQNCFSQVCSGAFYEAWGIFLPLQWGRDFLSRPGDELMWSAEPRPWTFCLVWRHTEMKRNQVQFFFSIMLHLPVYFSCLIQTHQQYIGHDSPD